MRSKIIYVIFIFLTVFLSNKCFFRRIRNKAPVCEEEKNRNYEHDLENTIYKGTHNNVTLAFLGSYGDLKFALGALSLAVEDVNKDDTLLPGKKLKFITANTGFQEWTERNVNKIEISKENKKEATQRELRFNSIVTVKKMTEMKRRGAMAFIGPDRSCTTEAIVAAAWNMPMISYGCADDEVSDKNTFYTFGRTSPPSSKISKSVVSLLKTFDWHTFVLVTSTNPTWCLATRNAIQDLAEKHNLRVIKSYQFSNYIPKNIQEINSIVEESHSITRVYVFIGEHIALLDFVTCMSRKKLLERGDYLIISIDDEIYQPSNRTFRIEGDADVLYNGFKSVLKFTPSYMKDSSYKLFFPSSVKFVSYEVFKNSQRYDFLRERDIRNRIKEYSTKEPFNLPFHQKIFDTTKIPVSAYHLYDAVKLYAASLTDMMRTSEDIYNGRAILQRLYHKIYHSIRGYDIYIDGNGDAEGNYSIVTMTIENISQNNIMHISMQPVGYFQCVGKSNHNELPLFKYIDQNKTFQWVGGKKPRAEPECGFDGEKCSHPISWKSITIFLFLFVLGVGVAALIIRYYRYEQKLACLLWRVDMKDVIVLDAPVHSKHLSKLMDYKVHVEDKNAIIASSQKHPNLTLACYKGNLVVMRRIAKKTVDLSNPIHNKLVRLKELRHENLVQIIGACMEPTACFIFMEYLSRGNLQDVLANMDIKLDQMFISSLVSDILNGMAYLHQSSIGFHGNLRSSNCLIDKRWVLRLSDFGGLVEYEEIEKVEDPNIRKKQAQRKLYRSPELLRGANKQAISLQGLQKSDVYSFGILLYEITGRNGPWGKLEISEEEIIEKLESSNEGDPFRPDTKVLRTEKFVVECMGKCWDEDPNLRPEFTAVREQLKGLHNGLKCNIFDNMLARMEKYSSNLEDIVRERTQQLSREKKRTEELLHEILPPSVAERLKNGVRVIAESYDCVTIYFSDIVGFTAISAISTPLQVVDILNELYTTCDSILSQYDVYKVETIGDAYMVASGLPLRNGNRHAGEIASMALHLLQKIGNFHINHIPNEQLKIRMGIHSGSCVAGVIGTRMPRYCLFGDTVNTASRMETTGEPLKIHISETTKMLLYQLGGYYCLERGITHIKGKGEMKTYWLTHEDPSVQQKRSEYFNFSNY